MLLNKTWHHLGFIDDGLEQEQEIDSQGNIWRIDMNEENQEKWKLDEYGDMASLWEYR